MGKMSKKLEEAKAEGAKLARAAASKAAKVAKEDRNMHDIAAIGGGALAGVADAYDATVSLGPVTVGWGGLGGAVAYFAGRKMKHEGLRGAGLGAIAGEAAIMTSKLL